MKKTTLKKIISAAIITGAVAALGTATAITSSAEDVMQNESGFTPIIGTVMLDDTTATDAPVVEQSAEPESTFHWMGPASANNDEETEFHWMGPASANKSEEDKQNENNSGELREEDKSEKTKELEIVDKALHPIKEKLGIDDTVVDKVVDKLNDKFVEDTGHELPSAEKKFFTESGKILYNTVEGSAMGEIIPGIGGYRSMVKFNELMSKADDAKTPELREKYLKEAQECCKEGVVECIPGGSLVLSGTELTLSTVKYVGNKVAGLFDCSFDFDVNPLHWF